MGGLFYCSRILDRRRRISSSSRSPKLTNYHFNDQPFRKYWMAEEPILALGTEAAGFQASLFCHFYVKTIVHEKGFLLICVVV